MSQALKGSYDVAIGTRAVYVRVHGLATMNNCLCVRDFIEESLRACHCFVIIDLADCRGMDSTFMGVIAGAAMFRKEGVNVGVAIVNADDDSLKLLDSIGLTELVYVEPAPFDAEDVEFVELREEADEAERLKLVRSAHRHLVDISERNEKLFGPFLSEIEGEMKARGMI